MSKGFENTDRSVLRITGADCRGFLEGLVCNSVKKLEQGAVYAAMLGPQGKYLFDFILSPVPDGVLLDIRSNRAGDLIQRLNMYKLRANVTIEPTELKVVQGLGAAPEGAWADPRLAALGWRLYTHQVPDLARMEQADWDALRVKYVVPETGIELRPDETYILEAGFERLNGVDFRKGCYVGQEVTARMKHKTELKKGLVQVQIDGSALAGTPLLANEKPAGTLYTVDAGLGIAHLRFDRAGGDMMAGDAVVRMVVQ